MSSVRDSAILSVYLFCLSSRPEAAAIVDNETRNSLQTLACGHARI